MPTDTIKTLAKLFEAHGLTVAPHESWVVPNGELPAARLNWHQAPKGKAGQLDVEVLLANSTLIRESFAGFGDGEDAFLNGLENFTRNSFHVMLAALWNVVEDEQVAVETWSISGRKWSAYVGNFGTRKSGSTDVSVPDTLFPAIECAIASETLQEESHWFRTFFCNIGPSDRTFEALMDNEEWSAGESALRSIDWPVSDSYYSVRNFLMLRRT